MHPEPWWMFIPFALVLVPPVGVLMVAAAIWRHGGGLEGARNRSADRQYEREQRAQHKADRKLARA